ncbi:hypothetical protein EB796_003460 [Bugula neritina]|uniref:Uncharacterized protein n=1 Tax=Bugula neritina TaxID=10212 RepID=A0A7J7KJ01_BUGNE|nr:hypothetical protein EB796_003460 [Bugula neritina]
MIFYYPLMSKVLFTRSPSATRRVLAGGEERSGRRSASADTKSSPHVSGIPSPSFSKSPSDLRTKRRVLSGSMIPRSRPMTPSSSQRSLDKPSSPEVRSEFSENDSSRSVANLPHRSQAAVPSRSSVEPRMFQNGSSRPSRLPSARPSVTSATDLTSQDEQSPDLDPSSEDERDGVTGSPQIQVNENYPSTFLTQPNNSLNMKLPPSSENQTASAVFDTQDQITSMTDRTGTDPSHSPSPNFKNTKLTTKTTLDYEEVETTRKVRRIITKSPPTSSRTKESSHTNRGDNSEADKLKNRSKSLANASRLRQAGRALDRRALSEGRKDSPSQFGEAKALNDAIRMLEAKEAGDNKSSTEKSSWTPTLPEEMGDNSRPMSSTWTSLAEYDQSRDSKVKTASTR